MPALKLSAALAAALVLVAGLSGVSMAQDEGPTATHVTGTVVSDPGWSAPESMVTVEGIDRALGMRVERQVEWSDPRLPPTMTTLMTLDDYPDAITWAQSHRLDGPDGAWTATERGYGDDAGTFGLMVWTGEGGYEGLAALLVGKVTDSGDTLYEGYIFDGGLPPMPDPMVLTAE